MAPSSGGVQLQDGQKQAISSTPCSGGIPGRRCRVVRTVTSLGIDFGSDLAQPRSSQANGATSESRRAGQIQLGVAHARVAHTLGCCARIIDFLRRPRRLGRGNHLLAQGNLRCRNPGPRKPQAQPESSPPPQAAPPGTPPSKTVFDKSYVQGVLGKDVRSPTGEDMGHIVDVVVDGAGQPIKQLSSISGAFSASAAERLPWTGAPCTSRPPISRAR